MPQPVFRYNGKSGDVIDGAIFAFSRATDPDVLLLFEARQEEKVARWEYAVARMHVGALSLRYRNDEVWSAPQLEPPYLSEDGAYTILQDLPEPKLARE